MLAKQLQPRGEVLYVEPGQLTVTTEPYKIRTILGSCVAVCLYDPGQRIGGMNHFMLPVAHGGISSSTRYGDGAMPSLLERMLRVGADLHVLCAQVFGGARVLSAMTETTHLGQSNVEYALKWLDANHIPVMRTEVLGSTARRLEFDVACGAAQVGEIGQ